MRVVIAVAIMCVAGFGAFALWLAQPERAQKRGRLRVVTAAFSAALVTTFALSVSDWSPPIAVVNAAPVKAGSLGQVLALVRASNKITRLPTELNPPITLSAEKANFGQPPGDCFLQPEETAMAPCVFGSGEKTMVLYGDSHAAMWFQAIAAVAKRDGWRLIVLTKGACPASLLAVQLPHHPGDFTQCDVWHSEAVKRITALDPDLLVVSQQISHTPMGTIYSPTQWQTALTHTLNELPAKRKVVIGNIPFAPGPVCLAKHPVGRCEGNPFGSVAPYNRAERQAAADAHTAYVDVTPWFCAAKCSPVIGDFDVYHDNAHVAIGYTEYLGNVLGQALGI